MKKRDPDRGKVLSRRPPPANYQVGYARPPVETRFEPGQSGNPRGRPKGSKNRTKLPGPHEERLKTIILEEAYRAISVNDAKGPISIPMAQAVIRSLAVNAAKGNQRSQRLFAGLLTSVETANKHLHDECLETAITYKADWDRELERRKTLGIVAPQPIPHPDDVIIDMRTGFVSVKGPMTKEEQVLWDEFRERKKECGDTIAELEKLLKDEPNHPYRKQILEELEQERKIRAITSRVIRD